MIYWSEEDQNFYTIPDGDKATPKQIKDYYENIIEQVAIEIPINYKGGNKNK